MKTNGTPRSVFICSVALLATLFGGCTSYTKTHTIRWSGVFMVDSVTAGAVRLEYHEETPNNNTFADGRIYGINQKLYYYNFKRDSLFLFATLNDKMSSLPFSFSDHKDVDFNYPLLAYLTTSDGNTITSILNVETKLSILTTPFRGFFSSGRGYLVGDHQIMDLTTKDTSTIVNSNNGYLFYYNDTTKIGYGVETIHRNQPLPIFKYGSIGTSPESLGVLTLLKTFGRSNMNGEIVFQIPGKVSLGLLKIDSLKINLVSSDLISMGDSFGDLSGFDYSKHTGNFVLTTELRLNGGPPGLYVGNLSNKLSIKNVSPTIYEDE